MKKILIALLFIMAAFGLFAEVLITDSFDAATFPPTGWTNTATSGTYVWERVTAGVYPVCAPHSGAGFIRYNSYTATAGFGADLSTPSFNAATGYLYTVSFWMYRDPGFETLDDVLKVYTNNSATSTGGTLIATIHRCSTLEPVVTTAGWYNYSYEFSPLPATGNSYIIINALSGFGNDFMIDDVLVTRETGGSLAGTVTSGGNPLAGVTVTINNMTNEATTSATGTYSFPFVPVGTYTVTFSKIGYATQTLPATIVLNQATTLNAVMVALPVVNVTGTVYGSDAPTVGLVGATVDLVGTVNYTGTTNASGVFTITGVLSGSTYAYTISKVGYTNATGNITIGTTNYTMAPVTLNELSLPATGVQAAEIANHTAVNVTWGAPGIGGGEWIQWDTGENNDSIGTGGAADFVCASRWPAADLTDYAGQSLFAVRYFPAQAATFSIQVWTGGSAAAPGTLVVDQAVTPTFGAFNDVILTTPVPLVAGQELWFGYHVVATAGYPAGCDAGPQHEGLGNMMMWNGAWSTLSVVGGTNNLFFDWNIAGFLGYAAPTVERTVQMQALPMNTTYINTGTLAASGIINKMQNATVHNNVNDIRTLQGYKVWRLLQGQETNEGVWTQLTPNTITAQAYSDAGWATVGDGQYKWAVKAIYTNNVMSVPAFSNMILKQTQIGTIAGIVRSTANVPITGATVTAGTYTATSNTSGAYSMQVPAGTYTVTASKVGFVTGTQNGVVVVTGQTTTVNFNLVASAEVISEGFEGTTFPPTGWTQIITDTGAAVNGVLPTWCRVGAIAIDPPVNPQEGAWQAGLWWSATHQDEWLKTPSFTCPANAMLTFKTYAYYGSTYGDHYYVKVSTNGTTWTILWDSTAIPGAAWSDYTIPIEVDLAAYATQNIQLAFHADDPADNLGDWYVWFIDDVHVAGQIANDDNNTPVVTTALNGCYPNPFNPNTTISYSVKATTPVSVEIYNAKGQKVRTLVNETKAQGNHKIAWNGKDDNGTKCTSGVYLYKMNAGKFSSSKKMILMK